MIFRYFSEFCLSSSFTCVCPTHSNFIATSNLIWSANCLINFTEIFSDGIFIPENRKIFKVHFQTIGKKTKHQSFTWFSMAWLLVTVLLLIFSLYSFYNMLAVLDLTATRVFRDSLRKTFSATKAFFVSLKYFLLRIYVFDMLDDWGDQITRSLNLSLNQ